ncbi:hypothetical protein [Nonomuraea helvata]|uniref:Uncharacterized protein n=1 Tax=Nonomuraea helvata TaxID=37484 RepID=A0ABV5SJG2_9ACTN
MLTTRTTRSHRPAGRLTARAAVMLVLLIGVVFAHGGACAAVELSEPAIHAVDPAVDPAEGAAVDTAESTVGDTAGYDARCLHRELPSRHRHGTEPDCSAISLDDTPLSMATPATRSAAMAHGGAEIPIAPARAVRLAAPYLENLCVMRI